MNSGDDYWRGVRILRAQSPSPCVATSLLKAFAPAKAQALLALAEAPALRFTMPFRLDGLERRGPDAWLYGVVASRTALDASLADQGSVDCRLEPEELFGASSIGEARV